MTKENIIQNIKALKSHSHINYGIKTKTEDFTEKLFYTLFDSNAALDESIDELEFRFKEIAVLACKKPQNLCESIWDRFLEKLPGVLEKLNQDAEYILENDPASNSIDEVYLGYPGFYAIAIYRLSHELYHLDLLLFSRLMSEYAHRITGTDIHAGADIASPFFIDHATGIVIGETTVIKKHVKIYQGVTLGALSVSKEMKNAKRHPTVEANVCIYANATILGGETVIGKNSIVGGNAWITKSIPEDSIVLNTTTTEVKIKEKKIMNSHKLLNLIGNTPLMETVNLVKNKNVKLLLKLEGNNPGGSVKDRAAYNMIAAALERGDIKKGDKLIEATSGNTGIALAMIAQLFGIEIELVLPEDSTKERTQTMRAYGATVILTPASEGIIGSRDYADKKVAQGGYLMLNQFANDDNWKAHYKTTGPEIWNDTDGMVTHFVSAMGTTGTIIGTSTYLKEKNPNVQIVGAQPSDGSQIPGIRKWPQEYLPKIFDASKVDTVVDVSEEEARDMTKRLALEEGVFAGMSSGGSVAVALKIAEQLESGVVVAVICDRGDRYLSSDLFD